MASKAAVKQAAPYSKVAKRTQPKSQTAKPKSQPSQSKAKPKSQPSQSKAKPKSQPSQRAKSPQQTLKSQPAKKPAAKKASDPGTKKAAKPAAKKVMKGRKMESDAQLEQFVKEKAAAFQEKADAENAKKAKEAKATAAAAAKATAAAAKAKKKEEQDVATLIHTVKAQKEQMEQQLNQIEEMQRKLNASLRKSDKLWKTKIPACTPRTSGETDTSVAPTQVVDAGSESDNETLLDDDDDDYLNDGPYMPNATSSPSPRDIMHAELKANNYSDGEINFIMHYAELISHTDVSRPRAPVEKLPAEGDDCPGCDDFHCLRDWDNTHMPKDILAWLHNHRVVRDQRCPLHPDSPGGAFRNRRSKEIIEEKKQCKCIIDEDRCGVVWSRLFPWITGKERRKASWLIDLVRCITYKQSLHNNVPIERHTAAKMITPLLKCNEMAWMAEMRECWGKWDKFVVDETYLGKRKDNTGKKPRKIQLWMLTVTEVVQDPDTGGNRAGRSFWFLVENRERDTLLPIIKKFIRNERTEVWTDSHKSYSTLSQFCRHKVVNHKIGFRAADGTTTNIAEGAHGVIKRTIRKIWNHFGADYRLVVLRVHMACALMYHRTPTEKMQWLFTAMAEYGDIACMEDDPYQVPYAQIFSIIYAHQAAAKDRKVGRKSDREVPPLSQDPRASKKSRFAILQENINPAPQFGAEGEGPMIPRLMMSCRQGHYIEVEVIFAALVPKAERMRNHQMRGQVAVMSLNGETRKGVCIARSPEHLAANLKLVCIVHYSNHYICVAFDPAQPAKMQVYDSLRPTNPRSDEIRVEMLGACKEFIKTTYCLDRAPAAYEMECTQQPVGCCDCGLHALNNALLFLGFTKQSLFDRGALSVIADRLDQYNARRPPPLCHDETMEKGAAAVEEDPDRLSSLSSVSSYGERWSEDASAGETDLDIHDEDSG